jgi:hypothetical protein
MRCEIYGTVSGSYPIAAFDIRCAVSWSSSSRNLVLRKLLGWQMYGTVSGLCPVKGFLYW